MAPPPSGRMWGYEAAYLHVYSGNDPAQQLYRASGYSPVNDPLATVTAPLRLVQGTLLEQLMVKQLGLPICLPGSLSEAAIASTAPSTRPPGACSPLI